MSASETGFDESNFRMLVRAAIVSKSPGSPSAYAATSFALASASSPLSEKIIIAIVPTTMTVTIVRIICIMNRFIIKKPRLAAEVPLLWPDWLTSTDPNPYERINC